MRSSDIGGVRLPLARFRKGYAAAAVDELLDRVEAALASWESGVPPTMRSTDFDPPGSRAGASAKVALPTGRFGPTYALDAVDDLLDAVQRQLADYEQQR